MQINQIETLAFLYYGYLPKKCNNEYELPYWLKSFVYEPNKYKNKANKELIYSGCTLLQKVFNNIGFDDTKFQVVPLSGGLDSRLILACLLNMGLKNKIITVTYGTPGTYDYDFGNIVSRHAGTYHVNFDLTKEKISLEKILKTLSDTDQWTYVFDKYYNDYIPNKFGATANYWSGFLGDPLAGSHLPLIELKSWREATQYFALTQKFVKSLDLCPESFDPESVLPKNSFFKKEKLSYFEQIDFSLRQPFYILPTISKSGFNYIFPFMEKEWISFMLSIPLEWRRGKKLYKEIFKFLYPKFYSIPSTDNPGSRRYINYFKRIGRKHLSFLSTWGVYERTNYIDFDSALRKKTDYMNLISGCMKSLMEKDIVPWIDLEELLKKHQEKKGNYGDALTLLTSLEILLRREMLKKTPQKKNG